jgi:hypothetical protein
MEDALADFGFLDLCSTWRLGERNEHGLLAYGAPYPVFFAKC